ncbi:MAG: helix-turn-helix transcriptional regulator [Chloroflexi bacterium]|nr:helix-turn-helix transcriptional regulator [Chloroflexota bacterium]
METRDLIKQKRQSLNLTQEQVAQFVGVSKATVSRWESGFIAQMKSGHIAKIAKILQLSPSMITGCSPADEVERLREELALSPERKALLKATSKLTPEAIKNITRMIQSFPDID